MFRTNTVNLTGEGLEEIQVDIFYNLCLPYLICPTAKVAALQECFIKDPLRSLVESIFTSSVMESCCFFFHLSDHQHEAINVFEFSGDGLNKTL